jgi:transcriptional regulator with XRE-family HTH domain
MGRKRRVLTPERSAVHRWGSELRARRDERGLSLAGLSRLARYDASYLGRLERGDQFATLPVAQACDRVLDAGGELFRSWQAADRERRAAYGPGGTVATASGGGPAEEMDLRLVSVMPLHAVTAMYGEQGLRARFAAEMARFPDPAGREQAARALQLAGDLHAADRRQREPYVNHLLRVALRITCHYGVDDTEVICAALLHDAVEDHAAELAAGGGRAAAVAALVGRFGPRVAGLVEAVTNPERIPGVDRHEQYRAHVAHSLAASPWARVIKASDFTDNGVGLIHTSGPKVPRLARKYAPLVPVLADLIARPDTPLAPPAKARILGQLVAAQQRFAVITQASASGTDSLTPAGRLGPARSGTPGSAI